MTPAVTVNVDSEARTFTTKHGTVAKMNTAAIAKRPATAALVASRRNAYMFPTLRENMMSDGWAVEVKMKVLGGGESKQTYYACVPDKLGAEDRINATDHVIVTARNLVLASVFEAMNVKLGDVSQWDIMGYDAQRPQGASKVDRGLYFPLSLGSLTGRCREVLIAVGLPWGRCDL